MLFYLFIAFFSLALYVWFNLLRVPKSLRGLPSIPGFWVKPSVRRKIAAEVAKSHPLARTFLFSWNLVVLHPEPAKIVENSATLYEKQELNKGFPRFSFLKQFLGTPNVVMVQTEDWKRHRAVVNPAFDFNYIRGFTSIFSEVADTLIGELRKYKPSESVNAHDWMQRYTLDCLGRTAFGFDFESVKDPSSEYSQAYHRLIDIGPGKKGVFYAPRMATPWGLYDLIPTSINRRLAKDMAKWTDLLNRMAKIGESTAADSDLASHLMKANKPGAPNPLTMEEIRSNLTVFFLAGHETSATSLASALWFLGRYQDVQQKAYEEIVRVCGKTDDPTFDSQKELEYLTQVIYESNRLVPPAQGISSRVLTQDSELCGRKLEKGTQVSVSIETLHMLEREWPEPTKFDPERFGPGAHRHPFSWQAFGAGPRACLGRNFSILEQRVVLAKLLQAFHVGLPEGAPNMVAIADVPGLVRVESPITLQPRNEHL